MKLKFTAALLFAVSLGLTATRATGQDISGRWEIVHMSGDNAAQTDLFPGGFSTFLSAGGGGYTYGTTANSICVIDGGTTNVVPTWTSLGGSDFQITIAIDNQGLGPNPSFVYAGTYNALTPVAGNPSVFIPAITGTYYAVGDASACSVATQSSPGNFVATFLPTLASGSSTGSLDGFTAEGGSPFDATVDATLNFSAPPADGQIAGTVSLASNPTFGGNACFATTSGSVNPLTIDSNLSIQSGISETVYAEGLDPQGAPTTLILNGFSANLYTTSANTNPYADQITSTEWAVAAAIGEDDSTVSGGAGVNNDGTNNVMVQFYNVVGGACDGAGGPDAPFHFLAGKRVVHRHRGPHFRGKTPVQNRERDRRQAR